MCVCVCVCGGGGGRVHTMFYSFIFFNVDNYLAVPFIELARGEPGVWEMGAMSISFARTGLLASHTSLILLIA